MAIIAETGAGLASAESYASVAEANAYFAARKNAAWDAADVVDQKEPALRQAAQYLDVQYRFKGARLSLDQALSWPRSGVSFDGYILRSDAVPRQIKDACCELAVRAITGSLLADTAAQYVASVAVGPIHRTMSAPTNGGQQRYAVVDALLRGLVRGDGGIAVVRA